MLVDLENIVRVEAGWLTDQEACGVLARALALGGPTDFRLAVAPCGVLRRYAGTLSALHLCCEPVTPGPDAADLALLEHAEHLIGVGYRRFTVLSGDHIFAALCRRHPTTVITRAGRPVARELRKTAVAVMAA